MVEGEESGVDVVDATIDEDEEEVEEEGGKDEDEEADAPCLSGAVAGESMCRPLFSTGRRGEGSSGFLSTALAILGI